MFPALGEKTAAVVGTFTTRKRSPRFPVVAHLP
jgi:hypothetical protein